MMRLVTIMFESESALINSCLEYLCLRTWCYLDKAVEPLGDGILVGGNRLLGLGL